MQKNSYYTIPQSLPNRLGKLLAHLQTDCAPVFENFFENTLKKMDLVSRGTLEAQTRVLEQSQQKLQILEEKLRTLETAKN